MRRTKTYDKNCRRFDYSGGNLEHQDNKFGGDGRALKPETRPSLPDADYTALKPKWCDTCSAKVACHHLEEG